MNHESPMFTAAPWEVGKPTKNVGRIIWRSDGNGIRYHCICQRVEREADAKLRHLSSSARTVGPSVLSVGLRKFTQILSPGSTHRRRWNGITTPRITSSTRGDGVAIVATGNGRHHERKHSSAHCAFRLSFPCGHYRLHRQEDMSEPFHFLHDALLLLAGFMLAIFVDIMREIVKGWK